MVTTMVAAFSKSPAGPWWVAIANPNAASKAIMEIAVPRSQAAQPRQPGSAASQLAQHQQECDRGGQAGE